MVLRAFDRLRVEGPQLLELAVALLVEHLSWRAVLRGVRV
jgi:hypothetical protein